MYVYIYILYIMYPPSLLRPCFREGNMLEPSIYIYRERERYVCIYRYIDIYSCVCTYIYIYIYIYSSLLQPCFRVWPEGGYARVLYYVWYSNNYNIYIYI